MTRFFPVTKRLIAAISVVMLFSTCRKNVGSLVPVPLPPEEIPEVFIAAPLPIPISFELNKAFGGYYISLPEDYMESEKNYPILIFLHGAGQTGNGTTDLEYILNDGIGRLLQNRKFPATFNAGGNSYSFIVASPQYSSPPSSTEMDELVRYFKTTYRVDEKRIYLAGLSQGARIATLAAGRTPSNFAALVPIAGVAPIAGMDARCDSIAKNNLPVWAFHNLDDPMSDVRVTERFIETIRNFGPAVSPRLTIFDVYGHDAWSRSLDPAYREDGMNIYEWMLRYSR